MNRRPTPETDAFFFRTDIDWDMEVDFARRLECERDEALEEMAKWKHMAIEADKRFVEVLRERDEWKSKFIQQNKDLGCEMMDPGGTIWDYAKKLQEENKTLQEQLDAAIMLGKMQERRHERELAEARGESFQVQAWKQLTEQHRNEMRGL